MCVYIYIYTYVYTRMMHATDRTAASFGQSGDLTRPGPAPREEAPAQS